LSAVIQQSNAAAQQIASAIAQIAQAVDQQSTAAQDNSTLAEVVENAANEISDKAQISLDKITAQQELLRKIDTESKTVIEGISTAASANIESANRIRALNDEVSKLERIVGKLQTINILTNLIAVTGRIESAKAREHGSGFAAVSANIRELVEQSAEQLSDIGERIRLIQETIVTVAGNVQQAGIKVSQEVESAKETISRLAQVEDDMVEVVKVVAEIQVAAADSLTAIEEIKVNIDSISQAAEQASAACQQASSAASQQGQAMKVMASTAEELAEQADEL